MYIRDPYAPTTTAGADYMTDLLPIVCGFLLVIVALVGLAIVRFPARRFAIAITFTGLVLAVGVHPFVDPSPIAELVPRRRSARAVAGAALEHPRLPLLAIGLALGGAALVDPIGRTIAWRRTVFAAAVVLVALGNLPVLTGHGLVDPALERDEQPPAAWTDGGGRSRRAARRATGCCSCRAPSSGRSPGATPSIRRCPALSDRPLVTRDLLPLGSPAAMDLLVRPRRPLPGRIGRARRPSPRSPACSAPTRSGCPATPRSTASGPRARS